MFNRRNLLIGGGLALAGCGQPPAKQRTPSGPRTYSGFYPPQAGARLPLTAPLIGREGATTLAAVMSGRPALICLWAHWCQPCLAEKPSFDQLAGRLEAAGARIKLLSIRAFDGPPDLAGAIATYQDMGLTHLQPYVDATPGENGPFADYLGAAPGRRPSLPDALLVDSQGNDLGRRPVSAIQFDIDENEGNGLTFEQMQQRYPTTSVWEKPATFEDLRSISA